MSRQFSTHSVVEEIAALFAARGNSNYGGEAVTQLEHGLQAAFLAEQEQAPAALVVAALLHDVGHLLHDLPEDAPDDGIDDVHESLAGKWMTGKFPAEVIAPVAMHVAAKRYLAARQPGYFEQLSEPSQVSLRLQGGPMTDTQCNTFERGPHFQAAIRLRRWDDTAKVPKLATPPLSHYLALVEQIALPASS